MRTRYVWKGCLGFIFLVVMLCLLMQPAFAAGKSKNAKDSVIVETPTQSHQEKVDKILANSGRPPIVVDPVWYYKIVPGNGKYMYKEFKKGHPNSNSGWTPCPPEGCPYGQ